MSYRIPIPDNKGGYQTILVTENDITELEEQIFQIASKLKNSELCIVVNKPQYLALRAYRKAVGYPLLMCGFRILPGWCSKPVVVEVD